MADARANLYYTRPCLITSEHYELNPISLGFQGISLINENLKIVNF